MHYSYGIAGNEWMVLFGECRHREDREITMMRETLLQSKSIVITSDLAACQRLNSDLVGACSAAAGDSSRPRSCHDGEPAMVEQETAAVFRADPVIELRPTAKGLQPRLPRL